MVVGDFTQNVQTLIIGAGPGGYVAAIRAAQLGQEVVLVEKELLGGVCLNWGCIPSKAMIEVAGLKHFLKSAHEMGLITGDVRVELPQLHTWKNSIIEKLRIGINTLLEKNKVDIVIGSAVFDKDKSILVNTKSGLQRFKADNIILATGSSPAELAGIPFDGELVINSTHALALQTVPKELVVVGAGSVGLELGLVYSKLGANVTILEFLPALLPDLEPEIVRVLVRSLQKNNIKLITGAKVTGVEKSNGVAQVVYTTTKGEEKINADKILVSIGRTPNTGELGLEFAGVKPDAKGFIPVNNQMITEVKNIYAIGDLVLGAMLAHRASFMGKVAAEVISGIKSEFDNLAIPGVIFSDPEIATVGLTEAEAVKQGIKVKSGVFPFKALGRALTLGEADGMTKVVSDAETGSVLGVHIIGAHASDLIAEGALAVETSAHVEDLSLTIHAHPTLAEGISEAAEAVENKAIHIFNPKS